MGSPGWSPGSGNKQFIHLDLVTFSSMVTKIIHIMYIVCKIKVIVLPNWNHLSSSIVDKCCASSKLFQNRKMWEQVHSELILKLYQIEKK